MKQAGLSVALIPLAILIVGIALFSDYTTTYAVTFDPRWGYDLCDDFDDDADIANSSCTDSLTAGATADVTTHVGWSPPDSNFTFFALTTSPDAFIAPSADIPIGAVVGNIDNAVTLGLANSPCNVDPLVQFTFYNGETDPDNSAGAWPEGFSDRFGVLWMEDSEDDDGDGMYSEDGFVGDETPGTMPTGTYYTDGDDDGDTLVNEDPPDNNNGGIPNHAAYYPSFLIPIFDPDLDGLKLDPAANGPIPTRVPHARYSGLSLVLGVPVILQLVQFAPGALADFPPGHTFTDIDTSMGWVSQVILQDTGEVVPGPSAISAFCETVSDNVLKGTVGGVDRYKNPPAGTGLADPATGDGTNTHLYINFSISQRDLDGDGIGNGDTYDTCATIANPGWDPTALRPQAMDADSDGIPEVDTNANTVIDADDGCDNILSLGLGKIDHEAHPETDIPGACDNALDDDKDGRVNDGCLKAGADPELNQCDNATDDDTADADGKVNDGCPVILVISEADIPGACDNATDDDLDFRVNDGCPQAGATAEFNQCDNAVNDDAGDDVKINDGCWFDPILVIAVGDNFASGDDNCPILFNPLQTQGENSKTWAFATDTNGDTVPDGGPRSDSMGDECDPRPDKADGDYLADAAIVAKCITPGVDTDGDGFCDETEVALGSCYTDDLSGDDCATQGFTSIGGGGTAVDSTPEHDMVQPPLPLVRGTGAGLGATGGVATPCSDGADNDGDTLTDTDPDCGSPGDDDNDGLDDDTVDNCGTGNLAYNPTQTDTDGDTLGDPCDADRDGDGSTDYREWWTGTDVTDDCPNNSDHDAWTFDVDKSRTISIDDLLGVPDSFKNSFNAAMGEPKYNRRFDFDANQVVNIDDLLGVPDSFKNSFGTSCTP